MGRLVITHSTYLEGLIPCLKRLVREPEIDTITPAVISRVKGRAPELRLKISIPIRGGWKLVARRGSSAQEVFVVTGLSAIELHSVVAGDPREDGEIFRGSVVGVAAAIAQQVDALMPEIKVQWIGVGGTKAVSGQAK